MAISVETSGRILCTLKEEFIERVIPSHMMDCLGDFLDQRDEASNISFTFRYDR